MNYSKNYGFFEEQECAQMVPGDNYSADLYSQQASPYSVTYSDCASATSATPSRSSDCWDNINSPASVDDFSHFLQDDGQSVPVYEHHQHLQAYTFDGQLVKPEPTTLLECLTGTTSNYNGCYPQQQHYPVMELARTKFEEAAQMARDIAYTDVNVACRELNISRDPLNWSVENTRAWILWTCEQYHLSTANVEKHRFYHMDGFALCLLDEADFKDSKFSEHLMWALDIWKSASEPLKMEQSMSDFDQYLQPQASPSGQIGQDSFLGHNGLVYTLGGGQLYPGSLSSSLSGQHNFGSLDFSSAMSIGSPESTPDSGFDGACGTSDDGEYDCEADSPSSSTGSHTHLWQFLKQMLENPRFQSAIRWTDRAEGIFKIDDSALVAKKWGQRKHRPAMNYDKLSRSIRQYYKKGIMKKTARSQRLVYQFCSQYAH